MALEFYVEQADRSPQSGLANEAIYAGELVNDGPADGVDLLSFADTGQVGLARYDAEAMAAEWDEEVVDEVYDAGQRVQYQPQEDSAIVKVRTIGDETATAVSIGHQNVVGVVDETVGDAPANADGRLVEEGYTNGATTFDRATGNFKAVGVAYRPGQRAGEKLTEYDDPVRVILFSELKA